MSDFLNHLASRSFGFTPAIRPHLTALFEPLHGAGPQLAGFAPQAGIEKSAFSEEMKGGALHQDQFSTRRPVSAMPTLSETRTHAAESQMELQSHVFSPDSGAPRFGTDQQDPPERGTASLEVRSTGSKPEGKLRSFTRHQESQVAPSGWDRETRGGDVSQASSRESRLEGEVAHPDALSAAPMRSSAKVDGSRGHLLPARANSSRPLARDQIPVPIVGVPATFPFASSRWNGGSRPDLIRARTLGSSARRVGREAAADQVDSEPAIQVSIGRIEVKATPPKDGSGRVERPPSSVMSLDEYLRRRSKRGGE
jgi:hypothetical protein